MEGPSADPSRPRRGVVRLLAGLALLAVCLWPWSKHLLREPSLLGDDPPRVEDLQLRPLSALWLRPFNEHLSPVFETVSWLAWRAAGRRLAAAPMAFTVASYLPFVLLLLALGRLARRALGSWAAARVVVAIFALTPVYAEVVYWYSASSFAWALAAACLALEAADRARETGSLRASAVAGLMTFLAPCGSAIGLLAGPAAAVVSWPGRGGRARWAAPAAALLGMGLYLAMAMVVEQHAVVGQSVKKSSQFLPAVPWMLRAPLYLLASGPLGLRGAEAWPTAAGAIALVAAAVAAIVWIARGGPWRWIVAASGLIAGGYLLTYPFRVEIFPGTEILIAGRYHLFPQAGLALLIGAAAVPGLSWLGRRRRWAPSAVAVALTLVLALAGRPAIRARALWHNFPEQVSTLRGLDRLADVCRGRGVTRDQAIARLDPILARWANPGYNLLRMLPPTADRPHVPDDRVRSTVIAALDAREREIIFGGMDATSHLVADGSLPRGPSDTIAGRLVQQFRVRPAGPAGQYETQGWPAYLEYAFPETAQPPVALRLPGLAATEEVQIWWTDAAGLWSSRRSVTLALKPVGGRLADSLLPLADIPHWQPGEGRNVRVFFSRPCRIALVAPEMVRGGMR